MFLKGLFLFESSWKKPYSTRGVRALLARYASLAGLEHNMPPHRLRHFLFTWLKTQGIDDALIQPYLGHASRTSLEIYSRVALAGPGHRGCCQTGDSHLAKVIPGGRSRLKPEATTPLKRIAKRVPEADPLAEQRCWPGE